MERERGGEWQWQWQWQWVHRAVVLYTCKGHARQAQFCLQDWHRTGNGVHDVSYSLDLWWLVLAHVIVIRHRFVSFSTCLFPRFASTYVKRTPCISRRFVVISRRLVVLPTSARLPGFRTVQACKFPHLRAASFPRLLNRTYFPRMGSLYGMGLGCMDPHTHERSENWGPHNSSPEKPLPFGVTIIKTLFATLSGHLVWTGTLPIFMHLRGNHEIKRNKGFGYVSPTDGTRIGGDFDHTIGALRPSSENEVPTYTCSICGR